MGATNQTTSANYAPQWQTTGFLAAGLLGGVALRRFGNRGALVQLSNRSRFWLGTAPFLAGGAWVSYKPFTKTKTLDCEVIKVDPKMSLIQRDRTSRVLERLGRPIARGSLYPASFPLAKLFIPQLSIDGERKIAIESPQTLGSKETLLLKGVQVKAKVRSEQETVALLFGGNGFLASHMKMWARHYFLKGIHVQMVDWRGYGASEGSPNAEGTCLDTAAMVEAAIKSFPNAQLVFHGISLGAHHAAVGAAYTAANHSDKVAACFLEQPFGKLSGAVENIVGSSKFANFVQGLYPYDTPLVVGDLLDNARAVKVRIFRGTADTMMNPKGVTVASGNPDDDINVEPIFQAVQKERPLVSREAVITDHPGWHCHPIWGTNAASVWENDIAEVLRP